MYGHERPHDKTLKVKHRFAYFIFIYFLISPLHFSPSPAHMTMPLTLTVFSLNPACVSARPCAPACGFTASQISLNARCCKAAAECNLTLTL